MGMSMGATFTGCTGKTLGVVGGLGHKAYEATAIPDNAAMAPVNPKAFFHFEALAFVALVHPKAG